MAIIKFKPKQQKIYQFRIDIKGAKPPIWRRIQVESDISFNEFHYIIQECFNWINSHLHHFLIDGNTRIVDVEREFHEAFYDTEINERKAKLNKFFISEGDILIYEYDFGDGWEHIIKLEKIIEKADKPYYPYLITGKKVAPFEDCGGIWGWKDICDAQKDKNHPERDELIEWYGEFDPDDFGRVDISEINAVFEDWEEELNDIKELEDSFL